MATRTKNRPSPALRAAAHPSTLVPVSQTRSGRSSGRGSGRRTLAAPPLGRPAALRPLPGRPPPRRSKQELHLHGRLAQIRAAPPPRRPDSAAPRSSRPDSRRPAASAPRLGHLVAHRVARRPNPSPVAPVPRRRLLTVLPKVRSVTFACALPGNLK